MLLLCSVIAAFVSAEMLGREASPLTAGMIAAMGVAILVIAARTAGQPGVATRICYLAAALAYLIALPWWHAVLWPHYAAAPPPLGWGIPFVYLLIAPLLLCLAPVFSRLSYGLAAYEFARRGRV